MGEAAVYWDGLLQWFRGNPHTVYTLCLDVHCVNLAPLGNPSCEPGNWMSPAQLMG